MPEKLTIINSQLGSIQVDTDKVINFPDGLIGFEDLKNFVIIDFEEFEPFQWLLSMDDTEITFPIISPILVVQDYDPIEWENHLENYQLIFVVF